MIWTASPTDTSRETRARAIPTFNVGENVPLVVTPTSRSPATTTISGRGMPRSVTRRPTTFSNGSVDV